MSDTDDSSISDNSWPVNEAWLIGVLTENHKCSEADINILVSEEELGFFKLQKRNFFFDKSKKLTSNRISMWKPPARMVLVI